MWESVSQLTPGLSAITSKLEFSYSPLKITCRNHEICLGYRKAIIKIQTLDEFY